VQVSKWGNSLAVRLPAAVVDVLELKEGDQIEVRIAGPREFEISRAAAGTRQSSDCGNFGVVYPPVSPSTG
jgi:antitoxin MazE